MTEDRDVTARRHLPRDSGFAALELVFGTSVLLAFLLVIVGFGRVAHGEEQVDHAAAAGARAASLSVTPARARADARAQALATLREAGVSCDAVDVSTDTGDFRAGGSVSVTVACQAVLADLTVVGFPGHKTLRATSVSPLDAYRQFGGQVR